MVGTAAKIGLEKSAAFHAPTNTNGVFSGYLAANSSKNKETPLPTGTAEAKEALRRAEFLKDLSEVAGAHGLKINNAAKEKINPQRVVFILGSSEEENKQRRNYKYGLAEVGDADGYPLSVTVPDGTPYTHVAAFMNEIRRSYLDGNRFKSTLIDSHGSVDGWIGTEAVKTDDENYKFPLEYNAFPGLSPGRVAELASFYEHTEHLIFSGCAIFGNLDEEDISKLRGLAQKYQVRIEANSTEAWRCWKFDEGGGFYFLRYAWTVNPIEGPGGNAFAFMPDNTIQKILRPDDDTSRDDTDFSRLERKYLKKAWKETGGGIIDERNAPYQISYGTITLTKRN